MGQRLLDAPCDIRDHDFWPWRSWRLLEIQTFVLYWCNILKFVGLPVWKICAFNLNISRPVDLDLWHWNQCVLLPVEWATLLPLLTFWVFSFSPYGPTPVRRTTWNSKFDFDLGVHGARRCDDDTGLRAASVFQVWSSYAFPFGRYDTFCCDSINHLSDLNLCPFDL